MPLVELTGTGGARAEGSGSVSSPRLKGKGTARAEGVGAVSGPAHLKGTGTEKAEGTGSLHRRDELVSASVARAEGTGYISVKEAVGPATGRTTAQGVGWLTWHTAPAVPNALLDAWRYGVAREKDMLGTGTCTAGGVGALST